MPMPLSKELHHEFIRYYSIPLIFFPFSKMKNKNIIIMHYGKKRKWKKRENKRRIKWNEIKEIEEVKKDERKKKREGLIASLFWLKLLAHKTRGSAAVGKRKKKTQSNTLSSSFLVPPPMPFKSGGPVRRVEQRQQSQHIHVYKQ